MELAKYIAENEFDWWINKLKRPKVRKLINENTGAKVLSKNFPQFVAEHMSIYGHWKRKPKSSLKTLKDSQWEDLRSAVEHLKDVITWIGLTAAYQVVLTKISTNPAQLTGLPKRMHYWNK